MGFFKKFFPKDIITETMQENQTAKEEDSNSFQDTENKNAALPSTNCMSKLFRTPKSFSVPPEALHENEAWAPESEYVGLFRKRRAYAEEQASSSSGPQ